MQNIEKFTYTKKASGMDISRVVWAAVFPVGIFFLCIFTIAVFKTFGRVLQAPMIGAIWVIGAAMALWMPSQRKSILKETLAVLTTYCAEQLVLRRLIAITSGASSQMLMATFGEAITSAAGNTIPGFLQNMLYWTAVFIPLGFLGMQGKRFLEFKRNRNKQKVLESLRNIHGE